MGVLPWGYQQLMQLHDSYQRSLAAVTLLIPMLKKKGREEKKKTKIR